MNTNLIIAVGTTITAVATGVATGYFINKKIDKEISKKGIFRRSYFGGHLEIIVEDKKKN